MRMKKIIAWLLVLTLYVNSVSYAIDFHYCQNEFRGVNFLGKAASCHSSQSSCKHHLDPSIDVDDMGCCSSQQYLLDELNTAALADGALLTVTDVPSYTMTPIVDLSRGLDELTVELIDQKNYRPPIAAVSYTILFQTFLL